MQGKKKRARVYSCTGDMYCLIEWSHVNMFMEHDCHKLHIYNHGWEISSFFVYFLIQRRRVSYCICIQVFWSVHVYIAMPGNVASLQNKSMYNMSNVHMYKTTLSLYCPLWEELLKAPHTLTSITRENLRICCFQTSRWRTVTTNIHVQISWILEYIHVHVHAYISYSIAWGA